MDVTIVLVAAALAVGVGIAVAWPLLRRSDSGDGAAPTGRRARLEEQLEVSLEAIREIEQDHRSGGLSDEDFETLNRDERTRAVALMRRLDALGADSRPTASETAETAAPEASADAPDRERK